ncbi:hypothetical protein EON65_16240 [archaeon]|nr:MAG: hypothetical protein EON65_16240 [archaeon]
MSEFEEKRKVPEALVADLLQPQKGNKSGPLIQDLSITEPEAKQLASIDTNKEEPTMLEMMMAAQREAREEQGKLKETEQKTVAKTGFSGFKKGFFEARGANPAAKAVPKSSSATAKTSSSTSASSTSSSRSSASQSEIIEVKAKTVSSTKRSDLKSAAKTSSGIVLPEVQSALESEKHPLLKQLENKGWYC